MQEYLKGRELYGDDFTEDQIKKWYDLEAEGYANLGSKDKEKYLYEYHQLNLVHGYEKLQKNRIFENVLGFGSAYGDEFLPIIDRIKAVTIIEPSDNLINTKIGNIVPKYVKPQISGKLDFADNSFDLITCFGTLHHIPNVSFVISEIIRVLKPDGILLLREPIVSMGDWTKPRTGLTKNERGIPDHIFDKIFSKHPVEIVSKDYCFTLTSYIQKIAGKIFPKAIYSYRIYIQLDRLISTLLAKNVHYSSKGILEKCAPSNLFYVIRKR